MFVLSSDNAPLYMTYQRNFHFAMEIKRKLRNLSRNQQCMYYWILEDEFVIDTNSQIPLRWLYMLKDFYFPSAEITLKEKPDFAERVRFASDALISDTLIRSSPLAMFSADVGPDHRIFSTKNESGKEILRRSKGLLSLAGEPLIESSSARGGIIFDNLYTQQWINFLREQEIKTLESQAECKVRGICSYDSLSPLVTNEDLLVTWCYLNKIGCVGEFKTHGLGDQQDIALIQQN